MEVDPPPGDHGESALVANLRHRHRNQIQNMRSLVGLFGRGLPAGRCRDAFADLRARFEALGQSSDDAPRDETMIEVDFAAFTERVVELLDTDGRHGVAVAGRPVAIAAGRADMSRQLLCEMIIALVRQGFPADAPGAGDIAVSAEDDTIVFRVAARGGEVLTAADGAPDIGWSVANGFARSLGGTLSKTSSRSLEIEARIPAKAPSR